MTTVDDANVHALAVRGNFDDCQALLKAMFNDHKFRDRVAMSGVNSINWGRIIAQIVYYFVAASALGSPDRKMSFTVPTGNFGDIFAGHVARKMGLPIADLVIATNSNDILARTLESGRYDVTGVMPTTSPSMDIQVSSNFERLLFEAEGRDGEAVQRAMDGLSQSGAFSLSSKAYEFISTGFSAGRCSEEQCKKTIKTTFHNSGYLLDPHSAVGLSVARRHMQTSSPMITLATAHPAKFPDAVKNASGHMPALPEWQGDLMQREEKFEVIDNDLTMIENYIASRSRVAN
jgi:threonine synthase